MRLLRRVPIVLAILFFVIALKRPAERTIWFALAVALLFVGLAVRRKDPP